MLKVTTGAVTLSFALLFMGSTAAQAKPQGGGGSGGVHHNFPGGGSPVFHPKPPTVGIKVPAPIMGIKPPMGIKPIGIKPIGLKPPVNIPKPKPPVIGLIGIKPIGVKPIGLKPPVIGIVIKPPVGLKPPVIGIVKPPVIGLKPPVIGIIKPPVGLKPPVIGIIKPPVIGIKPPVKPPVVIGIVIKPPHKPHHPHFPCPPVVIEPPWVQPPVVYYPVSEPQAIPEPVSMEVDAFDLSCRLPENGTAQDLLGVDALLTRTGQDTFELQGTVYGSDNTKSALGTQGVGTMEQTVNLSLSQGDQLYLEPAADSSLAGYLQGTVELLGRRDRNGLLCTLTQHKQ